MKIKDVQIDGFGVWAGLTVHSMPDSMTVFYGPNEAGKTTLMQFLRTMFYGFTPDRRTRYLPPVNGGKPGGAIRVTGPGGGYEICRRAQLDQGSTAGQVTVTGKDGLAQGQHRLAMLLGQVDESIFTNVFAIGLRELQELSTLDDTAAADELYKLSSGLDRVSLVDVTRQLRTARQQIVGVTPESGQMQQLMLQREKLKDEIDQLTGLGRRWSELASLRNTQTAELDELKERIAQWEVEAKSYEIAMQVRPTWQKRVEIKAAIEGLNARTDVPDSAAGTLADLNGEIDEREQKLQEIQQKRRALRDQARKLPLRRGILTLAARIEAASEQAPWINSLLKHIQRLDGQVDQTQDQLIEDARRLGISEEDQQALLDDRKMAQMPDLSRQAINQLAEPASEVRIWSTRLKQSKSQCEVDKKEADRLAEELGRSMESTGYDDIHAAIQSGGDRLNLYRKRIQIQETLDRQNAMRKQLEEEAVDLTVDEALPVERSFLLSILFVGGMFFFLWGIGKLLPMFNTVTETDSTTGLLMVVCGMFMLFFGMVWNNTLDRNTVNDLEDVEDKIDAIRKEIRKTEGEREELDRRLPNQNGTLETRLKHVEQEIASFEKLLPVQHNYHAAMERYKAGRKRAAQAADSLRSAKTAWKRTLLSLGLTESLSPKSVRIMAEGYDSLLQTRKRLQSLEEELESRQLELGAITQRIDSLASQVFAAKAASDVGSQHSEGADSEFDEFSTADEARLAALSADGNMPAKPLKADQQMAETALKQLNQMAALISSQEQYIHQKRALKEQDQQLAKQVSAMEKGLDKFKRNQSALLAEYGCESEEQLLEQLGLKHKHLELTNEFEEFGERIQAVIGAAVPYDTVAKLLDGAGAGDLEKRWEQIGQRTQQAEQRVDQLHERQGELSQEMKSLASNNRLSEAKLELVCTENQLKACSDHWQTLACTTGLLDKVCEVYETERQPETLREASAFLSQLTEGKYVRIWTPLGKNQLRIDNGKGQALPLEVLSRGTREAVFISLRLSLAAAYARRGVTIPLVLDDVLVNFDSIRAESAAKVLRDFAALGHQVVMFTCHEHIMRIFNDIGVQVRVLPPQGTPGEAEIYYPEPLEEAEPNYEPETLIEFEPEPEPAPVAEPAPTVEVQEVVEEDELVLEPEPEPEPEVVEVAKPKPLPLPLPPKPRPIVIAEPEPEPSIDWLWYERHPKQKPDDWVESDERVDERQVPPDLWWDPNTQSMAS